jgi:hypothetical protein
MPNNGYISSSGIDQVFTTGPYIGAVVTSSYSSGSTLLGPTITFYEAFISGALGDNNAINILSPCGTLFQRYYYDPVNCPVGDCLPPTIISATPSDCNQFNYLYYLFFNSGSTNAVYSTIQYSTTSDFSFNTGSYAVTNSLNNYTSSINIGNLDILPLINTPIYFRAFNSCSVSLSGTSSYSNIVSASCQVIPPPIIPSFTVRLKNSIIGYDSTLYYTNNRIEYALFGGNTTNLVISTLSDIEIPFRTLSPEGDVYTIIASGSSPSFDGIVTTALNDSTPTPLGAIVNQSVNNYPNNLYYNTEGTPDASVVVDRTLWNATGLIEIDFTSLVPTDQENPWYYEAPIDDSSGGGGCFSQGSPYDC